MADDQVTLQLQGAGIFQGTASLKICPLTVMMKSSDLCDSKNSVKKYLGN